MARSLRLLGWSGQSESDESMLVEMGVGSRIAGGSDTVVALWLESDGRGGRRSVGQLGSRQLGSSELAWGSGVLDTSCFRIVARTFVALFPPVEL